MIAFSPLPSSQVPSSFITHSSLPSSTSPFSRQQSSTIITSPRPTQPSLSQRSLDDVLVYVYSIVGSIFLILIASGSVLIARRIWRLHHQDQPIQPHFELGSLRSGGSGSPIVSVASSSSGEEIIFKRSSATLKAADTTTTPV